MGAPSEEEELELWEDKYLLEIHFEYRNITSRILYWKDGGANDMMRKKHSSKASKGNNQVKQILKSEAPCWLTHAPNPEGKHS